MDIAGKVKKFIAMKLLLNQKFVIYMWQAIARKITHVQADTISPPKVIVAVACQITAQVL